MPSFSLFHSLLAAYACAASGAASADPSPVSAAALAR